MSVPVGGRPYMPGYGIVGAHEGRGLLPWSWAEERLVASRSYWLATVRPDGRPHVMPVWGVWASDGVWFSSSNESRKAKNLSADPRAVITTDDPRQPIVVEGSAVPVRLPTAVEDFTRWTNEKYDTDYPVAFFADNACFCLEPRWVFALDDADFQGSPTSWTFRER